MKLKTVRKFKFEKLNKNYLNRYNYLKKNAEKYRN